MSRILAFFFVNLLVLASVACGRGPQASSVNETQSNAALLQSYQNLEATSPSTTAAFSADEIDALFTAVKNHPVASTAKTSYYDPTGAAGFCFGRAMAAHLIARQMGLQSGSIQKLFVVGDLRQRGAQQSEWRFHVTTLVKGQDNSWHAIDPIFARAITMEEWLNTVGQTWDRWRGDGKSHAVYYVTHPNAIMPDTRSLPHPTEETGQMLGEIAFNPSGKIGFQNIGDSLFSVSAGATGSHFITAGGARAFDFSGITYDYGYRLEFHGYFSDLLAALAKP